MASPPLHIFTQIFDSDSEKSGLSSVHHKLSGVHFHPQIYLIWPTKQKHLMAGEDEDGVCRY